MDQKSLKLKELLRGLAADFFSKESNRTSLITVTGVDLKSRNGRATVLFTVMPEDQEAAALDFMKRRLGDFREYVGEHARMMRVPFFDAELDKGEKNRQRLDEIEKDMRGM
ncbi:MAG: ribosome-binding factor A [Patescibacteria group bacterium]|nr:ribosome-binding factor A [Patescibacteria group bacterium]